MHTVTAGTASTEADASQALSRARQGAASRAATGEAAKVSRHVRADRGGAHPHRGETPRRKNSL